MRWLLATMVVLGWLWGPGRAFADQRRVRIETEPPGALVYLGDKEAGALGQTPVETSLEVGADTIVIIELDGYSPMIQSITPRPRGRAKKKVQVFSFTLQRALARLKVEGPAGARIIIDGELRGQIPDEFDVSAGAHQIEIKRPGFAPYEQYIDAEEGTETVVQVPATGAAATEEADAEAGEEGSGSSDEDEPPGTERAATKGRRLPWISVGVSADVVSRNFSYQNPGVQPANENRMLPMTQVQTVISLDAEFFPFRLGGRSGVLGRLSLVVGAGLGISQPVNAVAALALGPLTTFWRNFHGRVRYRIPVAKKIGVDLQAGYLRYLHRFEGMESDVQRMPDVAYSSLAVGGRVSYALGRFEPFAGFEKRFVLAGGQLQDRFPAGASVGGIAASLGTSIQIKRWLSARVEGYLTQYSWTFISDESDLYDADGATDRYLGVLMVLAATL
jgi:hypothetical protein